MKAYLFLLFLSIAATAVHGQIRCSQFDEILGKISAAYKRNDLDMALRYVRALRACDQAKQDSAEAWTERIFTRIQLNNAALEQSKKTLEQQQIQLQKSTKEAIRLKNEAEAARLETEMKGESNRLLIKAIEEKNNNLVVYARLLEESLKADSNNNAAIRFRHDLLSDTNTVFYQQALTGHEGSVQSIALTPDGRYILTGSADGKAKLWERDKSDPLRTFEGNESESTVSAVALTPDAKYMATGTENDDGIYLGHFWERDKSAPDTLGMNDEETVSAISVTPDGKFVLIGTVEGSVSLWERGKPLPVDTFKIKQAVGHENEEVRAVTLTPEADYYFLTIKQRTVRLWQRGKPDPIDSIRIRTFGADITVAAITPDAKYVLLGSDDNNVRLWVRAVPDSIKTYTGHTDDIKAVALTPDARFILSGSADNTAKLWKAEDDKPLLTFRGHSDAVTSVALTPDAQVIATGSEDHTVKLWGRKKPQPLQAFLASAGEYFPVAMTPDARFIFTGGSTSAILRQQGREDTVQIFSGHKRTITSVAMSPDSMFFLTGSADSTARLWERGKSDPLQIFSGHSKSVFSVAMTPNARYILTGSADNTARLWERGRKEPICTFRESSSVYAVAISSDGRYILTGSADNTAKLWERDKKAPLQTYQGHEKRVSSIAITPDAKYILTGSYDYTAKLWERDNPEEPLQTFSGHSRQINSVALSRNARYILTGSGDYTAKLWERGRPDPIQTYSGNMKAGSRYAVISVAITPDAKYILTGTRRGAKLWASPARVMQEIVPSLLTSEKINFKVPVTLEEILKAPGMQEKLDGIQYFEEKYKKDKNHVHLKAMQTLADAWFSRERVLSMTSDELDNWIKNQEKNAEKNRKSKEIASFYARQAQNLRGWQSNRDWLAQRTLNELFSMDSLPSTAKEVLAAKLGDTTNLNNTSLELLLKWQQTFPHPNLQASIEKELRDSNLLRERSFDNLLKWQRTYPNASLKTYTEQKLRDTNFLVNQAIEDLEKWQKIYDFPEIVRSINKNLRDSSFLSKQTIEDLKGWQKNYGFPEIASSVARLENDTAYWGRFGWFDLDDKWETQRANPAFRQALQKKLRMDTEEGIASAQADIARLDSISQIKPGSISNEEILREYYSLTFYQVMLGRYSDSQASLEKMLGYAPSEGWVQAFRPLVMLFLGKEEEAKTLFSQIKNNPWTFKRASFPTNKDFFLFALKRAEQNGNDPSLIAKATEWLKE